MRKEDEIFGAIFQKKFLEAVNLKKLKLEDSALKTKSNDFVIVNSNITVTQLSK